jgi:hypothetical protein
MIGLCVAAGVWAIAQVSVAPQPLSKWMPGGALLYLESSDFATQLQDWNRSDVKTKWLGSKNNEQYLTTRLALKLKEVYGEFSGAAGFEPNLAELETVAGTDSALGLYDIGRLDLVYISKLPAARLAQNVLTRVRSGYQARTAASDTYYVRQSGNRSAAFATVADYVVVSTREDLLVAALQLIHGSTTERSVSQDTWYSDSMTAMGSEAAGPVALRLVMDLPRVISTSYFRSYWVQRNTAEFRPYSAFLSQIRRSAGALEEKRVLLRTEQASIPTHEAATAALQRYIPNDAGLFRLWDTTSLDFAMDLIRQKFFAAGSGPSMARETAPVMAFDGPIGSESDLQTRINEAPKPSLGGGLILDPLKAVIASAGVEAILHLESSLPPDDTAFVRSDAVVALRASSQWNAANVRSALTSAVESYQSVGGTGLQWRNVTAGNRTLSQWDGLLPLTVYVDGQTLWLARTPALLTAALNQSAAPAAQGAAYVARYNHRGELGPYLRMMRMLDLSDQPGYSGFFSENIGSLASALDVIQSVSVTITETGTIQRQVVLYDLR